jgi:hypothetical protein
MQNATGMFAFHGIGNGIAMTAAYGFSGVFYGNSLVRIGYSQDYITPEAVDSSQIFFALSRMARTADETRPASVSVSACIAY